MDTEQLKDQAQRIRSMVSRPPAALATLIALVLSTEGQLSSELETFMGELCQVSIEQVRELVAEFQRHDTLQAAVRVCGDLACRLNGAQEIHTALIEQGHKDSIVFSSCLGHCYAAPVVARKDGTLCRGVLKITSKEQIDSGTPIPG